MKKTVILAFIFLLTGCATTKVNYAPITEQISFPELGQVTTVSIGEEMLKQGTFTELEGIELPADNNINNYLFSKGFIQK